MPILPLGDIQLKCFSWNPRHYSPPPTRSLLHPERQWSTLKTFCISRKMKWLFSKTWYRKENLFCILHKHTCASRGEVDFLCITRLLFGSSFRSSIALYPFCLPILMCFKASTFLYFKQKRFTQWTQKLKKSSLCDPLQARLQLTVSISQM